MQFIILKTSFTLKRYVIWYKQVITLKNVFYQKSLRIAIKLIKILFMLLRI